MAYTRTDVTYSYGFSNSATSVGGSITVNVNDWAAVFDETDVDAAVTAFLDSLASKTGVTLNSCTKMANGVEVSYL